MLYLNTDIPELKGFDTGICLSNLDVLDRRQDAISESLLAVLSELADAIVRDAYDHCSAEKELIVVPNAPHTMAYLVGGSAVKAQLFAFADRFFAPQQGEKR